MDIEQLWKNTQEELRVVLAPAVYQTFVVKTQLVSLLSNEATIACPNAYLSDLNQKRYYQLFKSALDNQKKADLRRHSIQTHFTYLFDSLCLFFPFRIEALASSAHIVSNLSRQINGLI